MMLVLILVGALLDFICCSRPSPPAVDIMHSTQPSAKCKFSVHKDGPDGEAVTGTISSEEPGFKPYAIIDENGCSLESSLYDDVTPIPSTDDLRESSILGSHSPTPLDDIPLCKGSNRFITTIESKTPRNEESSSRHADSITPPSRKENDILMDDADYDNGDMPTPIERRKALGSKTWSSQPDQGPQLFEIRNDLVASLTPLPPAPFHPPTPPPAPPLAFPIVPSLIVPPMPAPILSIDKLLQMDTIRRQRRDVDWDIVDLEPDIMMTRRVKRDYYDEAKDSGDIRKREKLDSSSESDQIDCDTDRISVDIRDLAVDMADFEIAKATVMNSCQILT
ncbi:hypothetical protein TELCIR_06935 [Teladorsagia circumcincta]|uniref:Uncharacterized protein n=1 Tax=Teladorsagia circumcincta TaxID=45464 RepID=A0A2G9UM05_TELCI|nr:hypothetical protein TELCIR_06935 [Teladorsagia circumcincta]